MLAAVRLCSARSNRSIRATSEVEVEVEGNEMQRSGSNTMQIKVKEDWERDVSKQARR
jgi:hypothetical protein